MKKYVIVLAVSLLALFAIGLAKASAPDTFALVKPSDFKISAPQSITVPPTFTAPQEQASQLADPSNESTDSGDTKPTAELPKPVTVISIILCNNVGGIIVADSNGEVHAAHYTNKQTAQAIQKLVPADHNLGINLGCPGNPSKDTTVL